MATLAFQIAGAAIGSAIPGLGTIGGMYAGTLVGSMIGATVGGVIDSQVLFPAMFGTPKAAGPQLNELQLAGANEGDTILEVYGRNVRIAGPVVYLPRLTEESVTQQQGGKHGTSVTNYQYRGNLMVKMCRGPITRVKKVWAESKLIYDASLPDAHPPISSNLLSFEVYTIMNGSGDYPPLTAIRIVSPPGGPDLTTLTNGLTVDVTGSSVTGNNRQWSIWRTWASGGSTYAILSPFRPAGSGAQAAGPTITITPQPSRDAAYLAVRFYLGTEVQSVDPAYEAERGSGNVPAYRGWACTFLEGLLLTDFGNRIPQLNFLIEESPTRTVAETIGLILERRGFSASDYDVSAVTGDLEGYSFPSSTSAVKALEPLMVAFNLSARESSGKLVFYPRDSSGTVSVPATDLAAHMSGEDYTRAIQFTDSPSTDLPSQVNVRYYDPEFDYQPAAQRERKIGKTLERVTSLDFPLVLTASQARGIAKRMLWSAWAERRQAKFVLPPEYFHLEDGDFASVVAGGQSYTVRVTEVSQGANFIHEVSGYVCSTSTSFTTASTSGTGRDLITDLYSPPSLLPLILDIPSLAESQNLVSGYFFGATTGSTSLPWRGGSLFDSLDDSSYTQEGTITTQATTGTCSDALSNASPWMWDLINEPTVVLMRGTLTSRTELEVLAGANTALIGDELVSFVNATLTAPNTYKLSKLLRGVRGTEHKINGHASGETFILVSEAIEYKPLNFSEVASSRWWKAVAYGGTLSLITSYTRTLGAATLRPFSPVNLNRSLDGSNNKTITWSRRTRTFFRQFSGLEAPIGEESELYDVEIWNFPAQDTLLRTFSNVTTPSVVYTAAQQTADGLTPGDLTYVKVFQRGVPYGRGISGDSVL